MNPASKIIPTNYTVSTTAVQIETSPQNEKTIIINNFGTAAIYLGNASTVTSSGANQGYILAAGAVISLAINANAQIWAICASVQASLNVAILELV